jgi:hypothetical protein
LFLFGRPFRRDVLMLRGSEGSRRGHDLRVLQLFLDWARSGPYGVRTMRLSSYTRFLTVVTATSLAAWGSLILISAL